MGLLHYFWWLFHGSFFPKMLFNRQRTARKVSRLLAFRNVYCVHGDLRRWKYYQWKAGWYVQPHHHPCGWIVWIGDLLVFHQLLAVVECCSIFPHAWQCFHPFYIFLFGFFQVTGGTYFVDILVPRNETLANIRYCQKQPQAILSRVCFTTWYRYEILFFFSTRPCWNGRHGKLVLRSG